MNQKFFILTLLFFYCFKTFAQLNPALDVQHYRFSIQLNDSNNVIKAEAQIVIRFLQDVKEVKLDLVQKKPNGNGMIVINIKQDESDINFVQDSQHVVINTAAKKGEEHQYTLTYEGIPADGLIISKNKYGDRTFFSDNWPDRAHNWLPCNDHPFDKAPVEFIVSAPEHYQVVSNGVQTEETNLPNHLKLTHWKEDVPISTKVMVIGAANFAINYVGNVDCIPIFSWVYAEDRDNGFQHYAIAKDILPWYIKNIGPYAYAKLANVQSKTIFGGMENASAIFYFENSVNDDTLDALFAHEIAHQWFGNSASETDWPHLWLSEGFATYMAHLYLESKYGVDSFNKRMGIDRMKTIAMSKKRNTPVVDTSEKNDLMKLLNDNTYRKGAWVLHMLRRKLGDSLFWKGIRTYYATYAGRNANTEDLKKIFENVSGQNLQAFFKQWLYTAGYPELDIEWKFNDAKKNVTLRIEQMQNDLFEFPLEISFSDGNKTVIQPVEVKDKITTKEIPLNINPTKIIADPNVNLLFEAQINKLQ
ncbi:MAG TPA: M1 family metallopeptidase [Chitinophagaceae bacterium]